MVETKTNVDFGWGEGKRHALADRLISKTLGSGLAYSLVLWCEHKLTPESAVKGDSITYTLAAYTTENDQGALFPNYTKGPVKGKIGDEIFPLSVSRSDQFALQGLIPALTHISNLDEFIGYVHGWNQMVKLNKSVDEKILASAEA